MSKVIEIATTRKFVERRTGLVLVQGQVSQSVGARIMKQNGSWLQDNDVLAQVVSYQCAEPAMTAETLFSNAMAATKAHPRFITPTAFLVRPDQALLFDEYARTMRQGGLLQRAVFTDAGAAAQWAAQQAQVAEYWRACEQRLQSALEWPSRCIDA